MGKKLFQLFPQDADTTASSRMEKFPLGKFTRSVGSFQKGGTIIFSLP